MAELEANTGRDFTEEIAVDERDAQALAPETMQADAILGTGCDTELTPTKNRYTVIKGGNSGLALEAMGDLIIVVEDKFRTGFECKVCDGEKHLDEPCQHCNGTGATTGNAGTFPCGFCKEFPGKKPCPECKGKGGLLIAPEIAQRRPTTGTVMSVGLETKLLVPGDRVLYSLFAGSAIQFKQRAVIRIMHEHEVMCRMYGTSKIGDAVK